MKIARMYCPQCESEQKCLGDQPNHLLHFLLSLVTFGAWLLVWFFIALGAGERWHCDTCGARIPQGGKAPRRKAAAGPKDTPPTPKPAPEDEEPKRYEIG